MNGITNYWNGWLAFYFAGLGVLFVISVISLLVLRYKLRRGVSEKLEDLVESVEDFDRRLNLIQGHAVDYMNSMSPEASKAIYQLQRLLSAQRTVIQQVEELVSQSESSSLLLADKTLTDSSRSVSKAPSTGKPEGDCGWEEVAESLLQCLGSNIANASARYGNTAISKRRSRRRTDQNLKSAKILAALKGERL